MIHYVINVHWYLFLKLLNCILSLGCFVDFTHYTVVYK